MKKSYLLILIFLLNFSLTAKEIPKFGDVSIKELEMKSCDFDKDAVAMILYHTSDLYFLDNRTIQEIKIRIKVFKDKGDEYAKIRLSYDSDEEEYIEDISGSTYNLENGKVVETKLEKNAIFKESGFDGEYNRVFAMPAVKPGSVIEYKYKFQRRYSLFFPAWSFQQRIPTLISRYTSLVSQSYLLKTRFFTTLPLEKHVNEGSGNTESEFTMRHIPALDEEQFMGSPNDYLQRICFELTTVNDTKGLAMLRGEASWPHIHEAMTTGFLTPYLYEHLNNPPATDNVYKEELGKLKTKKEKMVYIYDYVRSRMMWNHEYKFLSRIGIRKAWDKKTGSSADINIALIALLRDADIDAMPVLVSTKEHGMIIQFFPVLSAFNSVVASVDIDQQKYIMDASIKHLPYDLISSEIVNTSGFLIRKKAFEWIDLTEKNTINKRSMIFVSELDEQGLLKGEMKINSLQYARIHDMGIWNKGMENYIECYTKGRNGLTFSDVTVANLSNDTLPFIQTLKFSRELQSSGNYAYFNLNFFHNYIVNPFIKEQRYTDVDFESNQNYTLQGTVSIPEKYTIESLPKSMTLMMPDTSIIASRIVTSEFGIISCKIDIEYKRAIFSAADYSVLKDFYKKLFDMLDEKILLKK